jgi:DICT domain-containing protein
VSTFQHARHFTPATRRRYARLAESAAFVAAIGEGLTPEPAPGVRGTCLAGDDALLGEWDIAVLGPHFAAALVAADLGDDGPDAERRFRFVLTFDRDLVSDVVAALMSRVIAEPAPLLAAAAA